MANLRAIRQRMQTIKSISQVTSAMKLISTASLRKYQQHLQAASLHFKTVEHTINILNQYAAVKPSLVTERSTIKNEALIIITADKGLCGSYNDVVANLVHHLLKEKPHLQLYIIGTRGYNLLNSQHHQQIRMHISLKEMEPIGKMQTFIRSLIQQFEDNQLDQCHIIYTQFKSILSSHPQEEILFPLKLSAAGQFSSLFGIEPQEEEVFQALSEQYILARFYHMLQQSQVSEQATRMMAMDNSTRNGKEMLEKLGREYNRKRQQIITQEIMEIIGGAEAL